MGVGYDQAADSIKNNTLCSTVEDGLIDELPIVDDYLFNMEIWFLGDGHGRVVRENSSGILRERIGRNSLEHSLYDVRVVLGQIGAKLLYSGEDSRYRRLLSHNGIVEFSDNHDDEIGIGEEVGLVEGRLRLVYLS